MSKPEFYTRVGKYKVPLRNEKYLSIVTFKAGKDGAREGGDFAFWTAVFKVPQRKPFDKRKSKKLTGRARLILPPGDRFDRMKMELKNADRAAAREIYGHYW